MLAMLNRPQPADKRLVYALRYVRASVSGTRSRLQHGVCAAHIQVRKHPVEDARGVLGNRAIEVSEDQANSVENANKGTEGKIPRFARYVQRQPTHGGSWPYLESAYINLFPSTCARASRVRLASL